MAAQPEKKKEELPKPEPGRYYITIDQIKPLLRKYYWASLSAAGVSSGNVSEWLWNWFNYPREKGRVESIETIPPYLYGGMAEGFIRDYVLAKAPRWFPPQSINFAGPPGIGKSALVREAAEELAEELGLEFRDDIESGRHVFMPGTVHEELRSGKGIFIFLDVRASQMEPPDILGIPTYSRELGRTIYLPPMWLPRALFGIIFLDEFNLASSATLKSLYQLVLDRRIPASGYVLPPFVAVVAAMNRPGIDITEATPLPEPLANRMAHGIIHLTDSEKNSPVMKLYDFWLKWAETKGRIHPLIVEYIKATYRRRAALDWPQARPNEGKFYYPPLYKYYFMEVGGLEATGKGFAYPTPRSWEFLSRILGTIVSPEETRTALERYRETWEKFKQALQEKNVEEVRKAMEERIALLTEDTARKIFEIAKTLIGADEAYHFYMFLQLFTVEAGGMDYLRHGGTIFRAF